MAGLSGTYHQHEETNKKKKGKIKQKQKQSQKRLKKEKKHTLLNQTVLLYVRRSPSIITFDSYFCMF